ncbi:hypothetical protein AMELA_G00135840 [Ameiurus melas]|uniref:Uncharacterized protein n=1 Tax=Ameiurus melas TaxID=219545 RepID=A0A7J6AKD6_AMEME|nr:hypothetical protein AMELA_G00135840 [Ameiurus melas]
MSIKKVSKPNLSHSQVMNSLDSENLKLLELQTHSMNFLQQNGFPVQTALCTITGQMMSLEEIDCGYGLQKYLVRLLKYLPGTIVAKLTYTPQLLCKIGKMAARLDQVLLRRSCCSLLEMKLR